MTTDTELAPAPVRPGVDVVRLSTWFGVVFAACQLTVLAFFAIAVLPNGGSPSDPALERGRRVLDSADLYTAGNYVFMISGVLLLGFLGAVQYRLRTVDASGTLATVAVAGGTLVALIWPLAGVLHDVALDAGRDGADLRLLGSWDAVAPYSLAFSTLPRIFLLGALVLGLRAAGRAPWLQRIGGVLIVLSLAGSATLVVGEAFPLLAVSTLGYELWIGALAWHWLRRDTGRP